MSVRFNATGQYLKRTLNLPDPVSYTACFWFKRDGASGNTYDCAFSIFDATEAYQSAIYNRDSGTQRLTTWTGTPYSSTGVISNYSDSTWYFLALLNTAGGANGGRWYFGADGGALSTALINGTPTFTPARLSIGDNEYGTADEWSNCTIEGVRIWSGVALSQAELEAEKASTSPVRTSGLNTAWTWGAASPTDAAVDVSGNGRNWTLGGSPVYSSSEPSEPQGANPVRRRIMMGFG